MSYNNKTMPEHKVKVDLYLGDCLHTLRKLPDNSVDSIVTDPPYGLSKQPNMAEVLRHWLAGDDYAHTGGGFMGKGWDSFVPGPSVWRECLRVLKPGGHLLAFAGTRTMDLMGLSLRLAGFELRDSIGYVHDDESSGAPLLAWAYGSGFPKNLDVSKAIDSLDATEAQHSRRLRFTEWVRSTGVTSAQINKSTGTNMGSHYTTAASQPAIMTREHLEQCRHLLGEIPEWVEAEADVRSVESQNMKDRAVIGRDTKARSTSGSSALPTVGGDTVYKSWDITAPATDAAKQWAGWGTALKPSHEPVLIACKPLDEVAKWATITSELLQLGGKLWSMLSASVAESSFGLSQSEFAAACASARWSAEEKCSTRDALLEVMGMSQFELATVSSLNTVSSWLRILGEVSQRENTSIIEMASSTTIDWKTLRFLASKITPLTIIRGHKSGAWSPANACIAAKSLSATVATLSATLELSALAPVTSQWLEDCRVEGAKSLSPRLDPILVARKPLAGTVAENVQQFGTGAINVDGCRIGQGDQGRWPANLVHDGSESATAELGHAARFFYCAKASKRDRDEGCDKLPIGQTVGGGGLNNPMSSAYGSEKAPARNFHPTVKPTELMRWLVRLVTPPGGVVLDPFTGSGSTGKAAVLEGFNFIGCELGPDYMRIAVARIGHVMNAGKPRVILSACEAPK